MTLRCVVVSSYRHNCARIKSAVDTCGMSVYPRCTGLKRSPSGTETHSMNDSSLHDLEREPHVSEPASTAQNVPREETEGTVSRPARPTPEGTSGRGVFRNVFPVTETVREWDGSLGAGFELKDAARIRAPRSDGVNRLGTGWMFENGYGVKVVPAGPIRDVSVSLLPPDEAEADSQ